MFTGIIEALGTVEEVVPHGTLRQLRIGVPSAFLEGVSPGASIAVDGACLTPIRVGPDSFTVEVIGTTLTRTIVGNYAPGTRVNLERALALGTRLDGHLVQGHVDGLGRLLEVIEEGEFWRMRFQIPREVWTLTLLHGSITLNGVSLTVNALLDEEGVEVGIIPHTWQHTNLSLLLPGSPVNVEGDLIGKYVGRWLAQGLPLPSSFLSEE